MSTALAKLRNLGISAHIDSGKTTLTERILFYAERIRAMAEVRGTDGVGATMDSMDLEKERGITIQSAATHVIWKDHHINIIDTPGHVDFTIEVERALRVLDGAVMVLCGVAGVQSQSITVDRQMRRYDVPRLAFINKCDRVGANPARVADQLREQLRLNAILMQIPIGLGADFQGVVDLIQMKAIYYDGDNGEAVRYEEIPDELLLEADSRREVMLDALSHFSDELLEAILESRVTEEMIHEATRNGVLSLGLCPVFCGSAYKNKGVQSLLDAVNFYLPSPTDVKNYAVDPGDDDLQHEVSNDPDDETLAYAFKLEDTQYGQLTYIRIYQGRLAKGDTIYNARTGKKFKLGRVVRMHAEKMEEIEGSVAGDIIAIFGIDCASGDTFRSANCHLVLAAMHIPEPVIDLAVEPTDPKAADRFSKALQRFTKEDPTFRVRFDEKSDQTVISGMGELQLEVYIERIRREFKVDITVAAPKVAYRERLTRSVDFDYTHKKQTGGSGQYGRIIGTISPNDDGEWEYVNSVKGGNVPKEYIPSIEKGFRAMMDGGTLIGAPVDGMTVELKDGAAHSVDSSDMAFRTAARGAFRDAYPRGKPQVLEPVMNVTVEGPTEFQGDIVGSLLRRRGILVGTTEDQGFVRIEAEVPLSAMFGYATDLRSATQGKAEFTMEFYRYAPVPREVEENLVEEYRQNRGRKKQ